MKKIFIFDLGGTLVTANTLNEICGLNGNKEKSIEINKNAVKGEFHDVNALCERINLMKGISIKSINKLLDEGNYLRKGAKELFKWLRDNNFITVIITANIKPVVDYYQKVLNADYVFSSNPIIIDNKIQCMRIEDIPNGDFKYEWCKEIISKLNITKENVYAIGDTLRDKRMLSLAGNRFVVNPKGGIEQYADYVVKEDFCEIIDYLLSK